MLDLEVKKKMEELTNESIQENPISNNKKSSLIIKIAELEKLSPTDIEIYVKAICTNEMSKHVLEILISIMRSYSLTRLQPLPHLNNPIAYSIVKDMEEYLLENVSTMFDFKKQNLNINETRIKGITNFITKKYNKLCQTILSILKRRLLLIKK